MVDANDHTTCRQCSNYRGEIKQLEAKVKAATAMLSALRQLQADVQRALRNAQMAAVDFPQSPDVIHELAAEQRASEDTHGGAERPDELDPINNPHNRDQR